MEVWKTLPEFENYQVSTTGRVLSTRFNKVKILTPCLGNHGYFVVTLWREVQHIKLVHQLVAMTFLGHIPNKFTLVINHKDGNTLNNNVDNLEIVTNRENSTIKKHAPHSSKYSGVSWNNQARKWQAQIQFRRKPNHLGLFESEEKAKEAYDTALQRIITMDSL